jgi:thiamine-phosphate diphosphorylase
MDPVRERTNTILTLEAALAPLGPSLHSRLIPPEGISFGYAMRGARDSSGVAAVTGGIRDGDGFLRPFAPIAFSTDEPAIRAILTAMKFDPLIRSAAIFQFSDKALAVLEEDLFLECASYAAVPDRPGTSTLDWGIAFCCKDEVPDVIYENKSDKNAARIILFGEDPADVANNIIICSNRV